MVNFEFPCDVGDLVFMVMDCMMIPAVRKVASIRICKNWEDKYEIRFFAKNMGTNEICSFSIDDFNKTVFVNQEDAIKSIENNI